MLIPVLPAPPANPARASTDLQTRVRHARQGVCAVAAVVLLTLMLAG